MFRVDDMAEHHVADLCARYAGAFERFAHDLRPEFRGRDVLEGSAEGPYGGTNGTDDYNFSFHDGSFDWDGRPASRQPGETKRNTVKRAREELAIIAPRHKGQAHGGNLVLRNPDPGLEVRLDVPLHAG